MKKLLCIPILLALWFGAFKMNTNLRDLPLNRQERMTGVITAPESKRFMLGYSSVVADYVWIKTMLYFGGNYGKNDLPWLKSMINSVIMLNPGFFPPYEFAGVIMPEMTRDYDYCREVLLSGIGRVKDGEHRLHFYLAYLYYTHYRDYKAAAEHMAFASTAEYAPPFWKKFAATLFDNAGERDRSLDFLYAIYESTDSPTVKEELKKKIEAIIAGTSRKLKEKK